MRVEPHQLAVASPPAVPLVRELRPQLELVDAQQLRRPSPVPSVRQPALRDPPLGGLDVDLDVLGDVLEPQPRLAESLAEVVRSPSRAPLSRLSRNRGTFRTSPMEATSTSGGIPRTGGRRVGTLTELCLGPRTPADALPEDPDRLGLRHPPALPGPSDRPRRRRVPRLPARLQHPLRRRRRRPRDHRRARRRPGDRLARRLLPRGRPRRPGRPQHRVPRALPARDGRAPGARSSISTARSSAPLRESARQPTEMRDNIATGLGCELDRVNVKGKTNDGFGPEGRGEAISATVLVQLGVSRAQQWRLIPPPRGRSLRSHDHPALPRVARRPLPATPRRSVSPRACATPSPTVSGFDSGRAARRLAVDWPLSFLRWACWFAPRRSRSSRAPMPQRGSHRRSPPSAFTSSMRSYTIRLHRDCFPASIRVC